MSTPLPLCPTCQAILKKMPSRKTKCPACGNYMYMKRAPHETEKRLVSEAEAERIEQLWSDRAIEIEFFRMGHCHEVKKHEYEAKLAELRPVTDRRYLHLHTAFELTNEWLGIEKDLHKRKQLFAYLARLAHRLGREHESYLRLSHRSNLALKEMHYRRMGKELFVVVWSPDFACDTCRKNQGKRLSAEEAMNLDLLPCRGCTCRPDSFCHCYYEYAWD